MDLPIQLYDLVMLVVLVAAMLFGAWKGMAWQIASLASVVVSAAVAVHFSRPLAPLFSSTQPWNRFIAMLVLYLVTSMGIWLIFRLVSGMIDRVQLKEFDRQLGSLFGLAKGVLLCILITFFAVTLSETLRQSVLRSVSGRWIARLIERADPVLPAEVQTVLGKYIDELDRKLDPDTEPNDQPDDQPVEVLNASDWQGRGARLKSNLTDAARELEEAGRQLEKTIRSPSESPNTAGGQGSAVDDGASSSAERTGNDWWLF